MIMQLSSLSIQDIIAFGLKHEKARVEAASYNIAIANVALPNKNAASVLQVKTHPTFLNDIKNNVYLDSITDYKTKSISSIGMRFFTVYGPWGRPDMAPMLFAKAITNNKPIKVFR